MIKLFQMFCRLHLLFLMLLIGLSSFGQNKYSIKSKKAIHFYELASKNYREGKNKETLLELENAIKQNPEFVEAWLFKADVLHEMEETDLEIEAYNKAIEIDANFFPNVYFNLGNALLKQGKYSEALSQYNNFTAFSNASVRNKKLAERRMENCRFAINSMQHPVDFHPQNLGAGINSDLDEYWPCLTADEELLIFTRLVPIDDENKEIRIKNQEDFWVSHRKDSLWQPAEPLSKIINTQNNEGAQSITADGRYMYFTACDRSDGYGRCDIYYSVREGDVWSAPKNLGRPINSSDWEAQPSISADGRELFFVSNRKSGKGKMDIWKSRLLEISTDGTQRWSNPENLSINTANSEMSPFIHAGNQYLIFASDGLVGMGGFDLYKVNRIDRSTWAEPVNLGYPINTFNDEIGLVISARGNKAFFSSDRLQGKGKDIFSFDLPLALQPPTASWLKGKIFDAKTLLPVCASLLLVDLSSGDTIAQIKSDRKAGDFLICLPSGKDYLFSVDADTYLFYSDHFSMKDDQQKSNPQKLDIGLQKIGKGSEIVLRNVFFELDSWKIQPQSEIELNRLVDFLLTKPYLIIEIGGHTDNSGTEEHNRILSENRAKEVCNYLMLKGIGESRLRFKGYGSSQPIAGNQTFEGRALNRRTEFRIVE